jgi:RNA-directed DNA polymerase
MPNVYRASFGMRGKSSCQAVYAVTKYWMMGGVRRRGGGYLFIFIMKIQLVHTFENIISVENLLEAWKEFLPGKRAKKDVQEFQLRLMDNLFALHDDLANSTYRHGGYEAFNISDPKSRNIHKATVRDRLLHHAIYRILYPFFDKTFIADSFSCRVNKGTHAAIDRFRAFGYEVSQNNTRTCWVLKCDIKKFFANIDHGVLVNILRQHITDDHLLNLLCNIIESFSSERPGVGLPLGNLTSQLFVNIYMNEFDQFAKHRLKARHYIRYADDFIILSQDRAWLESQISLIQNFLGERLRLRLHPDKLFIKTLASGVDFLGWIHFPDHRVLRTATRRRMFKRIKEHPAPETIASYRGLLKHGNTYKIQL